MKRPSVPCLVLLLITGLLQPLTLTALAQQPSQDEPIKLRSELVQVDLVVLDKSGKPVRNLKKEDFTLTEDGKEQSISFFSQLTARRAGAPASAPARATAGRVEDQTEISPDAGRTIFLIFDPYFISFESYPRLRKGLQGFIKDSLGPQDQVAIINMSGGAAVFQHASDNKEVLSLALDTMLRKGTKNSETTPSDSLASVLDSGLEGLDRVQGNKIALAERNYRLKNTLRSLANISKNLSEVPGRKIAIFVSEYFPIFLDPGRLRDAVPDGTNYANELREIIGSARRGGLVFYTLDPQGLTANHIPGGTASSHQPASMFGGRTAPGENFNNLDLLRQNREGLRYLAESTGGQSILDTNDFRPGLERVVNDNETIYVLAYYPTNSSEDGKFRRLKISVKGRPDLTVRTREGYLARSSKDVAERPASKEERLSHAVSRLAPIRNIRVSLKHRGEGQPVQAVSGKAEVVVHIQPEPGLFKDEGGMHSATFEIAGFIYDLQNNQVDGFSRTVKLDLPDSRYTQLLGSGMTIPVEILMKKPGLYNIRVGVLEPQTGEIGTASN